MVLVPAEDFARGTVCIKRKGEKWIARSKEEEDVCWYIIIFIPHV